WRGAAGIDGWQSRQQAEFDSGETVGQAFVRRDSLVDSILDLERSDSVPVPVTIRGEPVTAVDRRELQGNIRRARACRQSQVIQSGRQKPYRPFGPNSIHS